MTRQISKVQFDSALAGLENYEYAPFHFEVPAHTLAVNQVNSYNSTYPLDNANSISNLQVNLAGLETVYRFFPGYLDLHLTGYDIIVISFYDGELLRTRCLTVSMSGSPVNVPQFFVNIRASLYNAPF